MISSISRLIWAATLLAAQVQSPRALFEKAQARERASDWPGAERLYASVIAADPNSAEAYANLGVVLAKQQRFAPAIDRYRSALRLKPQLTALHINLGLALLKTSQPALAAVEFQAFLARNPQDPRARQLFATALLEADQYSSAATEFEKLLPSDDLAVRLGLATAYARLNRRGDAEALFAGVLQKEKSPAVQLAVGQAYLAANDFDAAQAALERALALDAKLPGGHFTLGAIFWKRQMPGEAIGHWKRELELDAVHFESCFAVGAALVENNKLGEAEPYLVRSRGLRPAHAPTLYYLGRIFWKTGRTAAPLLEESVKLDPGNRAAHFLLAQIYKAQGNTSAAARELAAVKELAGQRVQEEIDILEKARQ
ncbi:MAG: tetratricopeptide repeat protein [Bryobacteraceae bacterium]